MNPREFHALAQELANGTRAVEFRTAVSRAYYSAYNVVVEVLEGMGFSVPEDATGHGYVRGGLQNSGDLDVQRVAQQLRTLGSMRNRADYEMGDTSVERQPTVQTLVEQARRMIETLDAVLSEPARYSSIRGSIQTWENRVYGTRS